jgi:allantoinase
MRLVVRSRRVVTPDGVREASVHIDNGVIAAVRPYADGEPALDVGDAAILPGLCDSHVHVNEPGRADWEGWSSASRAAAAGGITTICDMPLNSLPVTTTAPALAEKIESVHGQAVIDYGLWGGVVPGNDRELDALIDRGVRGFKCFLVHSGIDEFPDVAESDLALAMPVLARRGVPLLVHAELPQFLAPAAGDPRKYHSWLASRPHESEDEAIKLMLRMAQAFGCQVHIVHLSSSHAIPLLAAARQAGVPVTAETCPHYLTFAAEDIPDGATEFKCAPPIRQADNRERLWDGLRAGVLDCIVSDHSPCPGHMKGQGDFLAAWGGIASLELTLPAIWTQARARGFDLSDVARWMCERPAQLARLPKKGRIAPGCDADLVIFDTERSFRVDPARLHHRHPVTPYAGRELFGVVAKTLVRGSIVYDEGHFAPNAHGTLEPAA